MADKPISLAEARWDKGDNSPTTHSVREVLEVVLAKIDSGEVEADHVIVCLDLKDENPNAGRPAYYQGGTLRAFGQVGLLTACQHLLLGS